MLLAVNGSTPIRYNDLTSLLRVFVSLLDHTQNHCSITLVQCKIAQPPYKGDCGTDTVTQPVQHIAQTLTLRHITLNTHVTNVLTV